VQQNIDERSPAGRRFPGDAHVVARLHNCREIADEMTVDRNLAVLDQRFTSAPRSKPRGGKKTIQPHFSAWRRVASDKRPTVREPTSLDLPLSLFFGLGLGEANHALALLELTALFHQLDPLEALENAALGLDGAFALQAGMLTHRGEKSGRNSWKINRNPHTAAPPHAVSQGELHQAQFHPPLFAYHGLIPRRIPDQLDLSVVHTFYSEDFLPGVRCDRGSHPATRRSEGHAHQH